MEENKSLAIAAEAKQMIENLTESTDSFSSLSTKTALETAQVYNITNGDCSRIGDHINETIMVSDVFCEIVTIKDRDGVERPAPRVVLVSPDKTGYACVSKGIFGALKKLMAPPEKGGFGAPTWNPPIPLKIKQIDKGVDRKILSVQIDVSKMQEVIPANGKVTK